MLGLRVAGIWGKAQLGFEGEEAEAADCQFVAIGEAAPFDDLAVEEDAVEAAVVENAQRVGALGDDQGVAARDAGVVEADVGGGPATGAVRELIALTERKLGSARGAKVRSRSWGRSRC